MPLLRELQQQFCQAIYSQDKTLLPSLVSGGLTAGQRINLYRTSVRGILTDDLSAIYPVIKRLVGDEFFTMLADRYISQHPSACGDMHVYGGELATFLSSFEPARKLVYLPDVARLEWAVHKVFHAVDSSSLDIRRLKSVPSELQPYLVFHLQPAAAWLSSVWPVHRIWEANIAEADGSGVSLHQEKIYLLVYRRGFEVVVSEVNMAEYAFLRALQSGKCLARACESGLQQMDSFDPADVLPRWIAAGLIGGFCLLEDHNIRSHSA